MIRGGKFADLARVDWFGMKLRTRQAKPYSLNHPVIRPCDPSLCHLYTPYVSSSGKQTFEGIPSVDHALVATIHKRSESAPKTQDA